MHIDSPAVHASLHGCLFEALLPSLDPIKCKPGDGAGHRDCITHIVAQDAHRALLLEGCVHEKEEVGGEEVGFRFAVTAAPQRGLGEVDHHLRERSGRHVVR